MRARVTGVLVGVAVAALLIFEVANLTILGSHPMRVRDVVTELVGMLGIAALLGFLAWRDRHLFVTVVATAGILFAAMAAGWLVWIAYLVAVTPPPPPGLVDWSYSYPDQMVKTAILLGLGTAAAIFAAMTGLLVRPRPSD